MSAFLLLPSEGKAIALSGLGVVYKLDGGDTRGAFSIVEHPIEPGTLVPPHTHAHEDEFSYVLQGEIGVRIADEVVIATPGCYVLKPRGVPHTFWNAGPEPGRLIEIISPPHFERFFTEMAALFRDGNAPDLEQRAKLASRYGLTFQMEWVPELCEKYHLKLLGRGDQSALVEGGVTL